MDSKVAQPAVSSLLSTAGVQAWQVVLLAAMAGGMSWGIRGQYGHETGAMMAGLLVSATLILLGCPRLEAAVAMRAVAWTTIAIGFGGSMTYGQTVGLTHDRELVGNHHALLWGMLGLAIKGGLWIGFGGLFLGMGLGGKRYSAAEMLGVMSGVLALCYLGIQVVNEPYDPAQRVLPRIYFSDDWRWEPDAALKPRREVWGGMLFALAGLLAYVRVRKADRLAFRLGGWGILGGALGFPLGQCLQAYHAWNPEVFRAGIWVQVDPVMNWWNWMETTFGAVMGAVLGWGFWHNRDLIAPASSRPLAGQPPLPGWAAWALLLLHVTLLVGEQFTEVRWMNEFYDFGLILGFLPVVCVAGSRGWCYWMLPITLLPIAGKTLRELVYSQHTLSMPVGWMVYFVVPMSAIIGLSVWLQRRGRSRAAAGESFGPLLLVTSWLIFGLNFGFFRFPWPWETWTARTPNAVVFTVCLAGLTWVALRRGRSVSSATSA